MPAFLGICISAWLFVLRKGFCCPITLDNVSKLFKRSEAEANSVPCFLVAFWSIASEHSSRIFSAMLPQPSGDGKWLWHNAIHSDPPDPSLQNSVTLSGSLFSVCQSQVLLRRTGILEKLSDRFRFRKLYLTVLLCPLHSKKYMCCQVNCSEPTRAPAGTEKSQSHLFCPLTFSRGCLWGLSRHKKKQMDVSSTSDF